MVLGSHTHLLTTLFPVSAPPPWWAGPVRKMRSTRRAARSLTSGYLLEEKEDQQEQLGGVPIGLMEPALSPSLPPPRPKSSPLPSPSLPPLPPPPSSVSQLPNPPNGNFLTAARQILTAKNHSFDDEGGAELPQMLSSNSPELPRLMNATIPPMLWAVLVSTIDRPGMGNGRRERGQRGGVI